MTSSYLRDFIERELENCLPNLNPETRSRLANIAEAFVNNKISFNYALNIFTECSCPPSLITKFAHIKAVGDDPLPASKAKQFIPNKISNENSQSISQKSLQDDSGIQSDNTHNAISSNLQSGQSFSTATNKPDKLSVLQGNSNKINSNDFRNLNLNDNSSSNNFRNSFCLTKSYSRKKAAIWTEEEDMRLLTAVSRFGNHDWRMISAFVGSGRTSSQCNQRWTRALNPSISHHPWTPQEDQKLFDLVTQMGECGWRKIASYLNGRTDLQCRHRYLQMKRSKEKEIQKENEMKLSSGNVASSTVIPPFQNLSSSSGPPANISLETNQCEPNVVSQNSFNLAPQPIMPFVVVQNSVINYNYNINNPTNIIIPPNNAFIPDNNSTMNERSYSQITIDEELLNNGRKNLSSSAISSLPPLETINEFPFQRLPPLIFDRQNNSL